MKKVIVKMRGRLTAKAHATLVVGRGGNAWINELFWIHFDVHTQPIYDLREDMRRRILPEEGSHA